MMARCEKLKKLMFQTNPIQTKQIGHKFWRFCRIGLPPHPVVMDDHHLWKPLGSDRPPSPSIQREWFKVSKTSVFFRIGHGRSFPGPPIFV